MWLGYVFDFSLLSWGKLGLLWTFLLALLLLNPIGFGFSYFHFHSFIWICWFIFGDFPGGSDSKESVYNAGDPGSIPRLGRSPGKGNGYPLQCSSLENPHGQRSLVDYSPWGHKESDTTERLAHFRSSFVRAISQKSIMELRSFRDLEVHTLWRGTVIWGL